MANSTDHKSKGNKSLEEEYKNEVLAERDSIGCFDFLKSTRKSLQQRINKLFGCPSNTKNGKKPRQGKRRNRAVNEMEWVHAFSDLGISDDSNLYITPSLENLVASVITEEGNSFEGVPRPKTSFGRTDRPNAVLTEIASEQKSIVSESHKSDRVEKRVTFSDCDMRWYYDPEETDSETDSVIEEAVMSEPEDRCDSHVTESGSDLEETVPRLSNTVTTGLFSYTDYSSLTPVDIF